MRVTRKQLRQIISEALLLEALPLTGLGLFAELGIASSNGILTTAGGYAVQSSAAIIEIGGAATVTELTASTALASGETAVIVQSLKSLTTVALRTGKGPQIVQALNNSGRLAQGVQFTVTSEGGVGMTIAGAESGAAATTLSASLATAATVAGAIAAVFAIPALALYSLSTYKELDNRIKMLFRINDGNSITSGLKPETEQMSKSGLKIYKDDGSVSMFDKGTKHLVTLEATFPYLFTERGERSALRTQAEMPNFGGTAAGLEQAQKIMTLINENIIDAGNLYKGYMEKYVRPALVKAKTEAERVKQELEKLEVNAAKDETGDPTGEAGAVTPKANNQSGAEKSDKNNPKTDWERFFERSTSPDVARKIKPQWEKVSPNAPSYKDWVAWYNKTRKTGDAGAGLNILNIVGKEPGPETHLRASEVLDILTQIGQNSANEPAKRTINESLSRGALYRRRYRRY